MFNGILLINKPKNITSSDALNLIKKKFSLKKIGHAGTLDAFASGVLVAGVNEGTKVLPFFMEREKVYEAIFVLGKTTDTLDETGKIFDITNDVPPVSKINDVLKEFIGDIMQTPPDFSAVKVKGKRASDLVRSGNKVELLPRKVHIHNITVEKYLCSELYLKINCSKGTYIRALARDVGERLGCGAYVKRLVRTEISPYTLAMTKDLEDVLKTDDLEGLLVSIEKSLPFLDKIYVDEKEKDSLKKGRIVKRNEKIKDGIALALFENRAVGIVEVSKRTAGSVIIKPVRIINY